MRCRKDPLDACGLAVWLAVSLAGWLLFTGVAAAQTQSGPAALVDSGGGEQAFYTGANNHLWWWYWNRVSWSDGDLGGSVASGTSPAVAQTGNFEAAVGTDGGIWYWNLYGGGHDLGGTAAPGTSPAALVDAGGGEQIFYNGANNHLWWWYWNRVSWSDSDLGGSVAPGTSPAASQTGNFEAAVGTDGGIWYWNLYGGGHDLGGTAAPGTSPAVTVDSDGGEHIYYVGANDEIWQWYWNGSVWSDQDLGGSVARVAAPAPPPPPATPVQTIPVPAPVPVSTGPGRIHAKIVIAWTWIRVRTRLVHIRFGHLPRGARITLSCRGPHCPRLPAVLHAPRARKRPPLKRAVKALDGLTFHAGDRVHLTITASGFRPKRVIVKIRDGKLPVILSGT
jgi:hypothetical protein